MKQNKRQPAQSSSVKFNLFYWIYSIILLNLIDFNRFWPTNHPCRLNSRVQGWWSDLIGPSSPIAFFAKALGKHLNGTSIWTTLMHWGLLGKCKKQQSSKKSATWPDLTSSTVNCLINECFQLSTSKSQFWLVVTCCMLLQPGQWQWQGMLHPNLDDEPDWHHLQISRQGSPQSFQRSNEMMSAKRYPSYADCVGECQRSCIETAAGRCSWSHLAQIAHKVSAQQVSARTVCALGLPESISSHPVLTRWSHENV